MKWQLNLYKDILKSDEPTDPERNVERVQRISAALYHLEQVPSSMSAPCVFCSSMRGFFFFSCRDRFDFSECHYEREKLFLQHVRTDKYMHNF